MPHKRNPVRAERIAGLARVVRGHAQTALENVALWHERDISHSSAERVILPDATAAVDFMLAEFAEILDGLRVYPKLMRRNLDDSGGLTYSQGVLLALVVRGMSRDDAYAAVQRAATAAWDRGASFRDELRTDDAVGAVLNDDELEALFDPSVYVSELDGVFHRLEKLEISEP